MNSLTESQENYIKVIYNLIGGDEGAHVSDVALKLEVSRASASVAIKSLQQKNLVERDANRRVFLTQQGEQQAGLIINKFVIIKRFLVEVLHIESATAAMDACAIEHVLSNETLCSMCKQAGKDICSENCYLKIESKLQKG